MRFVMIDLDLSAEVTPTVELRSADRGVAILVRQRGRPLAFVLHEEPGPVRIDPPRLDRLVSAAAGPELAQEALRHELSGERSLPQPVSVTVAICTRDRPDRVVRCVRSLLEMRSATDARLPVLVVDNAPSDDGTRAAVDRLADVQYVCEPRPGLDFARNRALEEAQTAYVAFLDDDVVVDGAWLAGLEEALAEQPDAAIVTGLVLPLELETEAQILFELRGGFRRGFRKLRYEDADHPGSPLYPCGAGIFGAGCNMVVDRQALQSLGGFDEALDTGPPLPGGGDLDIFYRVIRSGRPLAYEPRMLVFHEHRREYDALRRQYRSWGAGFMSFVAKSYGWDVEERRSLRRVVRWWYTDQLRELASSLRSPSGTRPRLVGAELVGGIAGIAGTYQRSLRRARRIRERWATSNRCP